MTNLTMAQIAAYARGAGFTGQGLIKAVAVAWAESHGNPAAVNTNHDSYRSRDRGLWQINDHWHPEVTDAQAFNPASAAAAAYRISNHGRSWTAWSTYNDGAAAVYYGAARMAIAHSSSAASSTTAAGISIPGIPGSGTLIHDASPFTGITGMLLGGGPGSQAVGGVVSGITTTTQALARAVEFMARAAAWMADPHNWVRVVEVAGGAAAILVAIDLIADTGAAGKLAKGAARAGEAVAIA